MEDLPSDCVRIPMDWVSPIQCLKRPSMSVIAGSDDGNIVIFRSEVSRSVLSMDQSRLGGSTKNDIAPNANWQ